jgi:hypothetical protein
MSLGSWFQLLGLRGSTEDTKLESADTTVAESARAVHREKLLWEYLEQDTLSLDLVQKLVFAGIPECKKPAQRLRAVYWKILLKLLPLCTSAWSEAQKENRARYGSLLRAAFDNPLSPGGERVSGTESDVS